MKPSNAAKPATAGTVGELRNVEQLGGQLENNHTPGIITAQLVGSDRAMADGIEASGALDLCRRLLAAGADPRARLICYRDGKIALHVRSIGQGAELTVRETVTIGPRFVRWKPFRGGDVSAPSAQKVDRVLLEGAR